MPPEETPENLRESDRSAVKDTGADTFWQVLLANAKALQEAQKLNKDNVTSMTDLPALGADGKPVVQGTDEGFALTDGDQIIASKNVKQPSIYEAGDQDHLLGGKETTFLGHKAVQRNGITYLDARIENSPEVSQGVQDVDDLKELGTGIGQGLLQVGQETLNYLATPGAVEESLLQLGPALDNAVNYYANTPADQVLQDAKEALGYAGQVLEQTLGHPLKVEQRGERSGEAMAMMFPWGIRNAEISKMFPKLFASGKGVSAQFTARLESAIDSLPHTLRSTLEDADQRIVGVRRLSDVPELATGDDTILIARGKYQDGKIFVAEEHMRSGEWVKNQSPEGTMRHEIGHFVNSQSGEAGVLLSDLPEFVAAYERDVAAMPEHLRQTLRPLLTNDRVARDELFSEVIACRLGGPANMGYANALKEAFPEVLKVMGVSY
ncbi:MAG TPA: hypothetical protein V6D08_00445 [Candidatus Obscuribacterales bacterium]